MNTRRDKIKSVSRKRAVRDEKSLPAWKQTTLSFANLAKAAAKLGLQTSLKQRPSPFLSSSYKRVMGTIQGESQKETRPF